MRQLSLCIFCRHLRPGLPMTCAGFPTGIPERFWSGAEMHVEPTEGDNGLQFEPAEDLPEASRRIALQMVARWQEQHQKQAAS